MISPESIEDEYVCAMSLNQTDRIRLIGFPEAMIEPVRSAINSGWGNIQDERKYCGAHEYKLKGNPWRGVGNDAVKSRRLLHFILAEMGRKGWNVLQSVDVSKKPHDKDTLFFEVGTPDPEIRTFAISFNMRDRIRVIDGPEFYDPIRDTVVKHWTQGIQNEREYHDSQEIKLSGTPWYPDGVDTVLGRWLLCQILSTIRKMGYKIYASVDTSYGHGGSNNQLAPSDLDTWVFRKITPAWK